MHRGYDYSAYEYYKNADAYKTLTGVHAIHYQELKEAHELSEILQSESETKVSAFYRSCLIIACIEMKYQID